MDIRGKKDISSLFNALFYIYDGTFPFAAPFLRAWVPPGMTGVQQEWCYNIYK